MTYCQRLFQICACLLLLSRFTLRTQTTTTTPTIFRIGTDTLGGFSTPTHYPRREVLCSRNFTRRLQATRTCRHPDYPIDSASSGTTRHHSIYDLGLCASSSRTTPSDRGCGRAQNLDARQRLSRTGRLR